MIRPYRRMMRALLRRLHTDAFRGRSGASICGPLPNIRFPAPRLSELYRARRADEYPEVGDLTDTIAVLARTLRVDYRGAHHNELGAVFKSGSTGIRHAGLGKGLPRVLIANTTADSAREIIEGAVRDANAQPEVIVLSDGSESSKAPGLEFGESLRRVGYVVVTGTLRCRRDDERFRFLNNNGRKRLSVAFRPGVVNRNLPIVAHVHVPKNGGSSVKNVMNQSFGTGHVEYYADAPGVHYDISDIEQIVALYPDVKALSSHSFRAFPAEVLGVPMVYFCFLRDPVERLFSYYRYCRANYQSLHPKHRATLPEDFEHMRVGEYFEWRAARDRRTRQSPNRQVRFFTGGDDVERAKAVLESFLVVGITERMRDSLFLLEARLRALGIKIRGIGERRDNETRALYHETTKAREDPRVIAYLNDLGPDVELYRWAKDRLDADVAETEAGVPRRMRR